MYKHRRKIKKTINCKPLKQKKWNWHEIKQAAQMQIITQHLT
jgi:hypothetical protein